MQKYINEYFSVNKNQAVESNCNCVSFINAGGYDVVVNGYTIPAGGSLSQTGRKDEKDTTIYNVTFATSGTGDKLLWVMRKIFV